MPDTIVNTDSQTQPMMNKTSLNKEAFREFPLEELVHSKLETFIDQIDGYDVNDLYPIILERVERPLIQLVLKKTRGNQVRAASILGINRNTLRKKINHLKIRIKKPHVE